MKKYLLLIIVFTTFLVFGQNIKLKNEKEKVSYAIGMSFENNLESMEDSMPLDASPSVDDYIEGIKSVVSTQGKSASYTQGVVVGSQIQNYLNNIGAADKVDYNMVYAAIRAKFNNDSLLIPEDSASMIIQNYFKPYDEEFRNKQNENQQKRLDKIKEKNTKSSEAFLNANKTKPGIQTTANGLQYKVNQQGTGPSPSDKDKVQINYTGKLVDGTIFDSTNGAPISNNVNGFIPGFSEGLKLMNKGAKYTLYIPVNLAYGEQAPPSIGPNQALIFDVELVDFTPISAEEIKAMEEQKRRPQSIQQMPLQEAPQRAAPTH